MSTQEFIAYYRLRFEDGSSKRGSISNIGLRPHDDLILWQISKIEPSLLLAKDVFITNNYESDGYKALRPPHHVYGKHLPRILSHLHTKFGHN